MNVVDHAVCVENATACNRYVLSNKKIKDNAFRGFYPCLNRHAWGATLSLGDEASTGAG
jgi:hypothetical protein